MEGEPMKRTVALLLALMMLAFVPFAMAEPVRITENASGFDLTISLPADATVSEDNHDSVPYTFINFSDQAKPRIYISVAPNELYDAASVAKLSKSDRDALASDVSGEMANPTVTLKKTAEGYDYLLVEDNADIDSAVYVLLKEGYLIQMSVWHEDYATLTPEDNALATGLLDSLQIIPT
jgi:hypothetical protein